MRGRIETILDQTRGPDVLDLGCAGASLETARPVLHSRLHSLFETVWGLDASSAAVEEMNAAGFGGLHVGDAQDFALGRQFDSVVAGEIIEHVERPGDLLKAARSHLKPRGRIVLSTPYVFGLHNWLYATVRFPHTCSNPEHVQWFCPTTLTELARRSGLEVEYWTLTEDYDGAPNKAVVRLFYALMRIFGRVLPKRMRATSMVFTLVSVEG